MIVLKNNGKNFDFSYDWDNRVNDVNLSVPNINLNNNNAVRENQKQNNFQPNVEKVFNDDNTLKNNYNNQVQLALENKIYNQNEINESGIEPFPFDTMDNMDNNLPNLNLQNNNDPPIPNRRVKSENCECCSIM